METKKDIRKRILLKRDSISKAEWVKNSLIIQKKLVSHPVFMESDTMYCYVDYRNEVGTNFVISQALKLRKKVAVPKILGDSMEFFYITDVKELQKGYCGIMEPSTNLLATEKEALIIMPGVAFDKNRNRIGYGKGFYDRYIASHGNFKTIGIAFECQITDEIPADAFDYRPDILITEEHIYDQ